MANGKTLTSRPRRLRCRNTSQIAAMAAPTLVTIGPFRTRVRVSHLARTKPLVRWHRCAENLDWNSGSADSRGAGPTRSNPNRCKSSDVRASVQIWSGRAQHLIFD